MSDMDGPGQARRTDPRTAKAAALSIRPGSARAKLLEAHRQHPNGLTDEEAATIAGLSLTSEYATRCSELTRAGYLHDTMEVRAGSSGMGRVVRRVTALGGRNRMTPTDVARAEAELPPTTITAYHGGPLVASCPVCGSTTGPITQSVFDSRLGTAHCRNCRRDVQVRL